MATDLARFSFSGTAIDVPALQRELADPRCGGYAAFEGWVRNHNEGQEVTHLEYEAFAELAVREGERIIREACAKYGVENARCVHRVGDLALGELAVCVGVSAHHRDEAFKACRYIIDEVKHRVPIWKKEYYVSGDSGWVNCERCAIAPQHTHEHDHKHDHHHEPARSPAAPVMRAPDYSRQMNLREVGVAGQGKLRTARIAVVGAGGLGVPVLQFLAGAGVGKLIVIDGDRLEPSNLHRQTWYALADCGQAKAELAAARVRALNPEVEVEAHPQRLDALNAAQLLADAHLIIDCSDNFGTKFLLNDLAQALGRPAIFASVHQYEGQLQVVDPRRAGACLRCLWPEATRDGVVANCAEAGVLGPVPGVLGTLQALEALKIVLNLPGRLGDEVLTVDLLGLGTTRIRARRRTECAGICTLAANALRNATQQRQTEMAQGSPELQFDDLQLAVDSGYALIDIRDAKEIAATPLPVPTLAIPMNELLEGRNLPVDGRYLLVCARGARSLGTTRALRERGLSAVFSLQGGALGLVERSAGTRSTDR